LEIRWKRFNNYKKSAISCLQGNAKALVQPLADRAGLLRRPVHPDWSSGSRFAHLQAGGLALLGPLPSLPLSPDLHLIHWKHLHDFGTHS